MSEGFTNELTEILKIAVKINPALLEAPISPALERAAKERIAKAVHAESGGSGVPLGLGAIAGGLGLAGLGYILFPRRRKSNKVRQRKSYL